MGGEPVRNEVCRTLLCELCGKRYAGEPGPCEVCGEPCVGKGHWCPAKGRDGAVLVGPKIAWFGGRCDRCTELVAELWNSMPAGRSAQAAAIAALERVVGDRRMVDREVQELREYEQSLAELERIYDEDSG